ncbi:hypothetical protein BKA70DRAFT_1236482 [Coprinopsis sp. MPI-PUGE-AT-0042]|nr:hypothetical protein BKA70DRAFT_1236482 [Coprinopsis sp. MPI-PUGE-AT-0042]
MHDECFRPRENAVKAVPTDFRGKAKKRRRTRWLWAVLGATAVLQHLPVVFTRNSGKQGKRFAAVQRGNRVLRKGLTDGAKGYGKSDGCGYEETRRLTLLVCISLAIHLQALATSSLLHTHPNEQVFRYPCLFIRLSIRRLSQPRDGLASRVGTLQDGFDALEFGKLGSEIDDQVGSSRSGFACEADCGEYKNEDQGGREMGEGDGTTQPERCTPRCQPGMRIAECNDEEVLSLARQGGEGLHPDLSPAPQRYAPMPVTGLAARGCYGLGDDPYYAQDGRWHWTTANSTLASGVSAVGRSHPTTIASCKTPNSHETQLSPSQIFTVCECRASSPVSVCGTDATLDIDIHCIAFCRQTLLKTYARYVGEDRRELWPWVGVEVGFRMRSSLRKLTSN